MRSRPVVPLTPLAWAVPICLPIGILNALITSLESALTGPSQLTETTATLSLLECALTSISSASSLECALTKIPGVGVPPHLRAIRTQRPRARLIELLCFQILAHSFPRRRTLKCFLFNEFPTLSIATGGVGVPNLTSQVTNPLRPYRGLKSPRSTHVALPKHPVRPYHRPLTPNLTMPTPAIPGQVPIYEDYARCVHCGLCLNACPTYRLWNLEADSPRGRIHQMIQVELHQQPITESFVDHIDKCLDCRACETACPSGVEYGKLVEHARARIERDYPRSWLARVTRNFVFRLFLSEPHRLIGAARVLRFYQRSGCQAIARGLGVLKLLGLAERERLLPRVDDDFFYRHLGATFPAAGPRRARVAFFAGCIANVTFSQLNDATIRVLTANGCDVVVPDGQLCCGALAAHAGVRDVARGLARNNLSVFLHENFDAIITNAAGCGSTLKQYDRLFSPTEEEHPKAAAFAQKTRDVTEFLAALGLGGRKETIDRKSTRLNSSHT